MRGLRATVTLLLLTGAAWTPVQAQSEFHTRYDHTCLGLGQLSPLPSSLECDRLETLKKNPGFFQATGIAQTYVGPPWEPEYATPEEQQELADGLGSEPFVILAVIETEASIVIEETPFPEEEERTTEASASVDLHVGVAERIPPPVTVSQIPVTIRILGEATVSDPAAGGYVELRVQGDGETFVWSDPAALSISEVFASAFFQVGEAYNFFKFVNCTATVRRATPGQSSNRCFAALDPIFTLDQARFDEMLGASTFPLADHYELVFGPGLDPTGGLIFEDGFESGDASRW